MNVEITGPKILWESSWSVPLLGKFQLTESLLDAWIILAAIALLCWCLGRGLTVDKISKKQAVAELLVTTCKNFVIGNMGQRYAHFVPFIGALFSYSALCSLSSLIGLYPATSDLSTELSWALLVFVMITYTKIKTNGLGGYLLGFTTPIPVFTPFNIISELATPISMAFRHFGNIMSGGVISTLVYAALAVASNAMLGMLPGVLGEVLSLIPIFQLGIPAVLSIYFDLFSSLMQAFIFCMLTMLYIANAAEADG